MKKAKPNIDKRKNLHLTRPPRMEGKVKNAMMNPVRKVKQVRENQEKREEANG
ncbi:MAG: hypothetical protein Q7R90_02630 [bacterium]|nr:hypothetical protein [bacterium]